MRKLSFLSDDQTHGQLKIFFKLWGHRSSCISSSNKFISRKYGYTITQSTHDQLLFW